MGQEQDFLRSVAALLTKVAMADGDVTEDEKAEILDYFKRKLNVGDEKLTILDEVMTKTREQNTNVEELCRGYWEQSPEQEKLLALRLLYNVAFADGKIDRREEALICYIGTLFGLSDVDFTSIWAEFATDFSKYYDVLGIAPGAKPDEVEKAYKQAREKYDPQKVSHLGPEFVRLAEKKIALVEEAYRYFKKQLGI